MRKTRTLISGFLTAAIGLLAGCDGGDAKPSPRENAKAPAPTEANPTPPGNASAPAATATPPQPEVDSYALDPAKHVIPESPVAGRLVNGSFKPTVTVIGDTILFQMIKENNAVYEVALKLSPKQAGDAANGLHFTVKPEAPSGSDVPEVTVLTPGLANPLLYPNGYGLTLDLGKRDKGLVTGKVYLAFADEARSYMAGTFQAAWERTPDTPPGPEDAPFVQGKVTVTGGPAEPLLKVGFVGLTTEPTPANGRVSTPLSGSGGWSRMGSSAIAVAAGEKAAGRYEHIRLTPGRYLLYATLPDGPAAWKWVTVEAGCRSTVDLVIDAKPTGKAEVALEPDAKGELYLIPADESDSKIGGSVAAVAGLELWLTKMPMSGKATFEKLAPGRYEVWTAEKKLGTLDVKSGETAKLDAAMKK